MSDEDCTTDVCWEVTDDDEDADRFLADPEVWQDLWSEELVVMWHALMDKRGELGAAVLDRCTIGDFTQFCFEFSCGPNARRPGTALTADQEKWKNSCGRELDVMWHALTNARGELGAAVLDRCTPVDFAQFCFEFSSGRITRYPDDRN